MTPDSLSKDWIVEVRAAFSTNANNLSILTYSSI